MTTPTLTILPIAGHSKGCDRRAYVTIDGAPCMAGTMRAADEAAFVADYYAINEVETIILTESPGYAGCYHAAYDAGVKRNHREGAFLINYRLAYYTAEAMKEAAPRISIEQSGCAVTSHYEAPAALRILRDGETLNLRLVHRDGSHTDLRTTVTFDTWAMKAPITIVDSSEAAQVSA